MEWKYICHTENHNTVRRSNRRCIKAKKTYRKILRIFKKYLGGFLREIRLYIVRKRKR